MFFLVATFALIVMVIVVGEEPSMRVVRIPMQVLGTLTFWWAYILMRRSIEDKFSVSLGLFMTILFNFIYLQYHLRRIAKGEYHFRRGEEAKFSGR